MAITSLHEVDRTLALFVQGISNRVPIFQSVEQNRSLPTADLYELNVPVEFAFFDEPSNNRDLYRWLIMQQLALRRYDTLAFSIQTARDRIEFLRQKELPVSYRAPDLELFYKHFPVPSIASHLFFILEETRVGNLITLEFPGSKRLRQTYRHYRANTLSLPTQSPYIELVDLELRLQQPETLPASFKKLLKPIYRTNPSVYETADATVACYLALCADLHENVDLGPAHIQSELVELPALQRAARLEDWQDQLKELDDALLSIEFDGPVSHNQSTVDDAIDGTMRDANGDLAQERDRLKGRVDIERSLLSSHESTRAPESTRFRYDEWDYLQRTWRKAWCSVFEIRDIPDRLDSDQAMVQRIAPMLPAVRKYFEMVKPAGMRRVYRNLDGDELDINAIVEARADIKAGLTPSERLYSRVEKKHRDVAACLLVDLSASTDDSVSKEPVMPLPEDTEDPFDDPYLHGAIDFDPDQIIEKPPRKIIDVQKEAVLLLASALEDLGDLYNVYGFSGYGRDRVEMHVAKEFNEPLDRRAMHAIATMKPLRSTRMGPAIRHALQKLLATGSALKVLMVISDGFPQDCDYGPDRSSHEYGIQDTAKAIQEAREKGVQVFCVTVDVSGHDYLRRMCPDKQYQVIEDIEDLPRALQNVYRSLTA